MSLQSDSFYACSLLLQPTCGKKIAGSSPVAPFQILKMGIFGCSPSCRREEAPVAWEAGTCLLSLLQPRVCHLGELLSVTSRTWARGGV